MSGQHTTLFDNRENQAKKINESKLTQLEYQKYREFVDRGLLRTTSRQDLLSELAKLNPDTAKSTARRFIEEREREKQEELMKLATIKTDGESEEAFLRVLKKLEHKEVVKELGDLKKNPKVLDQSSRREKEAKVKELKELMLLMPLTDEALGAGTFSRAGYAELEQQNDPSKFSVKRSHGVVHKGGKIKDIPGIVYKTTLSGDPHVIFERAPAEEKKKPDLEKKEELSPGKKEELQALRDVLSHANVLGKASKIEDLKDELDIEITEDNKWRIEDGKLEHALTLAKAAVAEREELALKARKQLRDQMAKDPRGFFQKVQEAKQYKKDQWLGSPEQIELAKMHSRPAETKDVPFLSVRYNLPLNNEGNPIPYQHLTAEQLEEVLANPLVNHEGKYIPVHEKEEMLSNRINDLTKNVHAEVFEKIRSEFPNFKASKDRKIKKELGDTLARLKEIQDEENENIANAIAARELEIEDLREDGLTSDDEEIQEKTKELLSLMQNAQENVEKKAKLRLQQEKEADLDKLEKAIHENEILKQSLSSKEPEFKRLEEEINAQKQEFEEKRRAFESVESELRAKLEEADKNRRDKEKELEEERKKLLEESEKASSYGEKIKEIEADRDNKSAAAEELAIRLVELEGTMKKKRQPKLEIAKSEADYNLQPVERSEYGGQTEIDPEEMSEAGYGTEDLDGAAEAQQYHIEEQRRQQEESVAAKIKEELRAVYEKDYAEKKDAIERRHAESQQEREERHRHELKEAIERERQKNKEHTQPILSELDQTKSQRSALIFAKAQKEKDIEGYKAEAIRVEKEMKQLAHDLKLKTEALDEFKREKNPAAVDVLKNLRDKELKALDNSGTEVESFESELKNVGNSVHDRGNEKFKQLHMDHYEKMKAELERETADLFTKKILPKIHMESLRGGFDRSSTRHRIETAASNELMKELEKNKIEMYYKSMKDAENDLRESEKHKIDAAKVKAENRALHRAHLSRHGDRLQNIQKDIHHFDEIAEAKIRKLIAEEHLEKEALAREAEERAEKEARGKKGEVGPSQNLGAPPLPHAPHSAQYQGTSEQSHWGMAASNAAKIMLDHAALLGSNGSGQGGSK